MKKAMTLLVVTSALGGPAFASELDPVVSADIPQGLVVRTDADGKREVFKATLPQGIVDSEATATETINAVVKPENKIQSVTPGSELDSVTSDDSWHWYWNDCGSSRGYYNYSYSYGGGYYNYYPTYSYNYGGYRYNYYYTPVHYGYHSGFHYSDYSGWHWGGHYGWHGRSGHRWSR